MVTYTWVFTFVEALMIPVVCHRWGIWSYIMCWGHIGSMWRSWGWSSGNLILARDTVPPHCQTSVGEDVEKTESLCTVSGNAPWCSHWKAVCSYLKKLKMELTTIWPSSSISGTIYKETWNTNSKEYMCCCVHCSVIYNSQDLEAAQLSISRWVGKKAVVQLHNGTLLSCKK